MEFEELKRVRTLLKAEILIQKSLSSLYLYSIDKRKLSSVNFIKGSRNIASAHFNWLFETLSSPRATALKQTMQNVLMTTAEFSLDNTEY